MTSARTIARPPTQCPYCDHVSPEDSKFCNECGAALHLKPCPHCGSLNDITKTEACLRCGGAMLQQVAADEEASTAQQPAAPTPPVQPPQAANDALIVAEPPLMPPRGGPPLRRPRPAAVALILITALGTAGWYGVAALRAPPSAASPSPSLAARPGPALPSPVPAPAPAPVSTVAAPVDPAPAVSKSDEPAATPPARPARRAVTVAEPRSTPADRGGGEQTGRTDRREAIEPKTPPLGPCTPAVAALGLCSEGGR